MEADTRQGFRDALELAKGEALRKELEDDRPVAQLSSNPAERLSGDPAMIDHHRLAAYIVRVGRPSGLGDKARLPQQLVALERSVPVPRRARESEHDVGALAARPSLGVVLGGGDPVVESGDHV